MALNSCISMENHLRGGRALHTAAAACMPEQISLLGKEGLSDACIVPPLLTCSPFPSPCYLFTSSPKHLINVWHLLLAFVLLPCHPLLPPHPAAQRTGMPATTHPTPSLPCLATYVSHCMTAMTLLSSHLSKHGSFLCCMGVRLSFLY